MLAAQNLHCLNSGGFLWPALPILSASLVHRAVRTLCPTYALHQPFTPMIIKYRWMSVECTGNELGLKAARDDGFQVQGILRLW